MTLAVHGGRPVRERPFPPRPSYGMAERNAANYVVASSQLSGFIAEKDGGFYGGPHVQALEEQCCTHFGAPYAVTMNSATSCLFATLQALNLTSEDEVIVAPWTMSASVACVVATGAKAVFADIEPETYGIDPESVAGLITSRTKAVVVVDLFGCPARWGDLLSVVPESVYTVEDAAQAIGASYGARPAGTLGDVGVFSLNRHKTLQTGEGGIALTSESSLGGALRLIRNHGEVLAEPSYPDVVGQNYRMGEIEAAIALVQLQRIEELTVPRIQNAARLTHALGDLDGISPPVTPDGLRHVFYLYAVRIRPSIPLAPFMAALRAEGVPCSQYVAPLYRLPAFHLGTETRLPVVEDCHKEVLVLPHVHAGMQEEDLSDVIVAFKKVWRHQNEL